MWTVFAPQGTNVVKHPMHARTKSANGVAPVAPVRYKNLSGRTYHRDPQRLPGGEIDLQNREEYVDGDMYAPYGNGEQSSVFSCQDLQRQMTQKHGKVRRPVAFSYDDSVRHMHENSAMRSGIPERSDPDIPVTPSDRKFSSGLGSVFNGSWIPEDQANVYLDTSDSGSDSKRVDAKRDTTASLWPYSHRIYT